MRHWYTIVFCQLWLAMANGQTPEIDSLVNAIHGMRADTIKVKNYLHLVAMYYRVDDLQLAIATNNKALDLSKKLKYKSGESEALEKFGTIYYYNGEYDKGIEFYNAALKIRQEIKDEKAESYLLNNLAIIYMDRDAYALASNYLHKSLEINLKLENYDAVGSVYANLGLIQNKLGKYDSALSIQKKSLKYHQIEGDIIKIGNNFINMGSAHLRLGNTDSAINCYNRALKYYDSIPDNISRPKRYHQARAYNNLGSIYLKTGNTPKALEAYQKSLRIRITLGDKKGEAAVRFRLGSFYMTQENYAKAIDFFESTLALEQELENKSGIADVSIELGNIYRKQKKYSKALELLLASEKILREIESESNLIGVYLSLGSLFEETDQLDSAYVYYQLSMDISRDVKLKGGLVSAFLGIGRIHFQKNEFGKAAIHLEEAFDLGQDIKSVALTKEAAALLSNIYEAQGRSIEALAFFKQYHILHDSLENTETVRKITKLEMQYDFDRETDLLLSKQEEAERILQAKLARRQQAVYVTLIGLMLILILAVNLLLSVRRRKRDNRVIKAQKNKLEELIGFKEGLTHMIAHDMKNSLNNIIGLSARQPVAETMHGIQKSGVMSLNLVANMLDVQRFKEAKVPLEIKEFFVQDIFLEARSQTELLVRSRGLDLHIDTLNNLSILVDFDLMVRVIVNLITNAIKYSPIGTVISLNAFIEGDQVVLAVIDQGTGIKEEKLPHVFEKFWQYEATKSGRSASTGLGLTFCKLAVEAHAGTIKVKSKLGEGTTIEIRLDGVEQIMSSDSHVAISDSTELILEGEKSIIQEYALRMKSVDLYQVGELNEIFNQMENEGIRSPWFQQIRAAVQSFDQQRYHMLLES